MQRSPVLLNVTGYVPALSTTTEAGVNPRSNASIEISDTLGAALAAGSCDRVWPV